MTVRKTHLYKNVACMNQWELQMWHVSYALNSNETDFVPKNVPSNILSPEHNNHKLMISSSHYNIQIFINNEVERN